MKPIELTPSSFTGLSLTEPKTEAAGVTAVVSAMRHLLREMDPARAAQVMLALNQKEGIDCPGCAWPDPDEHRSKLGEYCENGAKAIAEEATTKGLDAAFFAQHSIVEMGAWSDFEIGKKGRLAEPMILHEGDTHYRPIAWEDVFTLLADRLTALASPHEAVFYTSGRTSNEAAFLYQLFVRAFGTNNLPDCAHLCHESSGVALTETLGIGKGSVTLEDLHHADVLVIMGQNPGTNHPRMLSALQKAKENGAKIITINPLPEAGLMNFRNPQRVKNLIGQATKLTDLFLQIRINADHALLKALMYLLWEAEQAAPNTVFDHDFIQTHTAGYEAFIHDLAQQNLAELIHATGLPEAQVREAATCLAGAKRIVVTWAMGLTQHKNAVAQIQEVVNLLLLKGSMGKKGAGVCPVRGHSNVQGDRTMGITEKPKPAFLEALERVFGFTPPQARGYTVVEALQAMHQGKVNVFFALGGNFLSAAPDTSFTAQALRQTELTVQVSTKLNRSHLVTGKTALMLPCLGRSDLDVQAGGAQFVSVENSMGIVHSSKGRLKPISKALLSEPMLVARMAAAVLSRFKPDDVFRQKLAQDFRTVAEDYDRIRDWIEATIPGFAQYNERVRRPEGFYLPNGARDRNFSTPNAKAQFTVHAYQPIALKNNALLMMTIRSHDQFNTTVYGLDDRYRGIYNERRVILMNTEDMEKQGLQSGDVVDLFNDTDGVERMAPHFIVVPFSIPPQCCATYFPETNTLVPITSFAEKSQTPSSKSVIIRLKKASV